MRKEHMRFGLGLRGVHTLLGNELLLVHAEYVCHDPRGCSFLEGEPSSDTQLPECGPAASINLQTPGPKVNSSKVSN